MKINRLELIVKLIEEFTVNGVCKYSKNRLAKIALHRYPDLFKNSEDARTSVRQVTKSRGKVDRKAIKTTTKYKWSGFSIPDPEKEDFDKVVINQKRIAILSDIHFPYYDKTALTAAIQSAIEFKPDCVILNGDIIDCYHLSTFEKDPKKRSFKYELDMLKNFFEQLRQIFPTQRIIYKLGNHEERYERHILSRVPELLELELLSFENVIKAKDYGVEVVKNKKVLKIGSLNVLHGHELKSGIISPVNIARGFFLRTKSSTLGGHHHRTSEHIEQNLNGEIIGCFSTGALCGLTPSYMPINSWNHGFALVESYGDSFHVRNLKIIDGKVL